VLPDLLELLIHPLQQRPADHKVRRMAGSGDFVLALLPVQVPLSRYKLVQRW